MNNTCRKVLILFCWVKRKQTLSELITVIEQDEKDFLSIPGLAFKQNNAIIKTVRRSVLKELDSLLFPPGI